MSINPTVKQTISGANWYSGYTIGVKTTIENSFTQTPAECFVFGNYQGIHPTTGIFANQYRKIALPRECSFRISRAIISSTIPDHLGGVGIVEPDSYAILHFPGRAVGNGAISYDVADDFRPKVNVQIGSEMVFGEGFPFLGKDISFDLNKLIFRNYEDAEIFSFGAIYCSIPLIDIQSILLNVSLFCEPIPDSEYDRLRKGC